MMYLMVDWASPRRDLIIAMVGSTIIPITDEVGVDYVVIDMARLDEDERARLRGIGGDCVRFLVTLGEDVTVVETSRVLGDRK